MEFLFQQVSHNSRIMNCLYSMANSVCANNCGDDISSFGTLGSPQIVMPNPADLALNTQTDQGVGYFVIS